MSGIPDFTILCAIDREHLTEFRLSFPTWIKNKPDLADRPILIVADLQPQLHNGNDPLAVDIMEAAGRWLPIVGVSPRPHSGQRERMLASLVFDGPAAIKTPYYLKLDCDTIATTQSDYDARTIVPRGAWIDPAWFDGNPAIIAPPWSYAKPGSMLGQLNFWADGVPHLRNGPGVKYRLSGPADGSGSLRAKYPRIISYCMFGRTDWTRKMAGFCNDRLPVPSQDTFLHYCAVRDRQLVVRTKMPGWRHIGGGGRRLRIAAEEAMGTSPKTGVTA